MAKFSLLESDVALIDRCDEPVDLWRVHRSSNDFAWRPKPAENQPVIIRVRRSDVAAAHAKRKARELFENAANLLGNEAVEQYMAFAVDTHVRWLGDDFISALAEMEAQSAPDLFAAALLALGAIRDPLSLESRLRLLEQCSNSTDPGIRESASDARDLIEVFTEAIG